MRMWVNLAVVLIVVALIGTAFAGPKLNKFGVSDLTKVNFVAPMHVGGTLLPAGDYEVRHTMVGEDHVMVFTQVNGKAEAKVKCTLIPTKEKAEQSQTIYMVNAAKERVLVRLIFKGDMAEHQF